MDEGLLGKCGFYCGCCPTYIKGGCKGFVDEHSEGNDPHDRVLKQGIANQTKSFFLWLERR